MPSQTQYNNPNCPPGLEYLSAVDQLLVHQKVELLEGIYYYHSNQKDVEWINDLNGQHLPDSKLLISTQSKIQWGRRFTTQPRFPTVALVNCVVRTVHSI